MFVTALVLSVRRAKQPHHCARDYHLRYFLSARGPLIRAREESGPHDTAAARDRRDEIIARLSELR